jgi:uncharacterized protein (DUF1697 family)
MRNFTSAFLIMGAVMSRYVALLRGINVGGKNLIKMAALKTCFEEQGFTDVVTYIQSGNVLFTAGESGSEKLARRIERALVEVFHCGASVVLRSRRQLQEIVRRAPAGFGGQPAQYRYDVIFLKAPLSAAVALKTVPRNPDVDRVLAGPGALYFSRLISRASQSRLSKLVSLPIYQSMTIRNWNTTTALLRLMDLPHD